MSNIFGNLINVLTAPVTKPLRTAGMSLDALMLGVDVVVDLGVRGVADGIIDDINNCVRNAKLTDAMLGQRVDKLSYKLYCVTKYGNLDRFQRDVAKAKFEMPTYVLTPEQVEERELAVQQAKVSRLKRKVKSATKLKNLEVKQLELQAQLDIINGSPSEASEASESEASSVEL